MGNTYGFSKIRREAFLSGKSRFIRDSDGLDIEDYNPDYIDIVGDLDREDYLYSLVKPKDGEIEGKDVELANYIKTAYSDDEQAMVVTLESVNRAIEVLVNLDKKVASMPCDKKSEVVETYKEYLEPGEWKYVEDKPLDPDFPEEKVYASSCKKNVDIYKEVEKVYGSRAYHYGFPWHNKGWRPGASYIIEVLTAVKNEMTNPENKDYVFSHPREWLYEYHMFVIAECLLRRHYNIDPKWVHPNYCGKNLPKSNTPDLGEYEPLFSPGESVYPEHDAAYLDECISNLARKGIKITRPQAA